MRFLKVVSFPALLFFASLLVWVFVKGVERLSGPDMVADFPRNVTIGSVELEKGSVSTSCMLFSRQDVDIIGVRVPCSCISSDELPKRLRKGEQDEVVFHIDLIAFRDAKGRQSQIEYELWFFCADGRRVKALLRLDLKAGANGAKEA